MQSALARQQSLGSLQGSSMFEQALSGGGVQVSTGAPPASSPVTVGYPLQAAATALSMAAISSTTVS